MPTVKQIHVLSRKFQNGVNLNILIQDNNSYLINKNYCNNCIGFFNKQAGTINVYNVYLSYR
jgi:hypothetical protein